jgi:hypothetical protein
MNRLQVPEPVSAGILLSYKCTSQCKHCMYACSPRWKADWLSHEDAEKVLGHLAGRLKPSPYGPHRIGVNSGLHITGGEPFLNFDLLLAVTKIAHRLGIPSTFVETNCFWCTDDDTTRTRMAGLKATGLVGILISVNPFILEEVPFERTERAVRIGTEVFESNALVYQAFFYEQFRELQIKGSLSFRKYLERAPHSLQFVELLPMGRAVYELEDLYVGYPARQFFGASCSGELTREWHVHIDNYCNYMPGFCGGISLGDARGLDELLGGIDLGRRPILKALATDLKHLFDLVARDYGYEAREQGYVSRCHLCIDLRRHMALKAPEFQELSPIELYRHL